MWIQGYIGVRGSGFRFGIYKGMMENVTENLECSVEVDVIEGFIVIITNGFGPGSLEKGTSNRDW